MSKLPVTVCIIAKNEEKYLEECLRRISKYGFEIIVTDTGSTDRTKEIAAKYADKVLDFEWINDFSAARNYCAQQASNNWILSLDCDEYVESIDVPQMRRAMQQNAGKVGFMLMKMLAYDNTGRLMYTTGEVFRLYNRRYHHYVEKIHEQLRRIGHEEEKNEIFRIMIDVVHQGYALTPEEMRVKQQRNLEMLLEAVKTEADNPYLYFQIGQSQFIIEQYEASAASFERAMNLIQDWKKGYVPLCIIGLAKAYGRLHRDEDSIALMAKYEEQYPMAQYAFYQACTYYDVGQKVKALFYFLKTAATRDFVTLGQNCADTYRFIVTIYHEIGQPDMAKPYVQKYEELEKEREAVMATALSV